MGAGRRFWLGAVAGGVAAVLVGAPPPVQAAEGDVLGVPCLPDAGVRVCAGTLATRIPSWDGVPLDVDFHLPPTSAAPPYPLIVGLHGFGATKAAGMDDPRAAIDYARQGYAVMTYSARGQGLSCGVPASRTSPGCDRGWIHLADARYEVRDTQHLAGLLVDAGLVKPRIGVTGSSYGGGQSLMLATLRNRVMQPDGSLVPWRSPAGTPLEIAAAAPRIGWSDLAAALVPTGRTLDYRSRNPYGDRVGIVKDSYLEGLFLVGETGWYAPAGADPEADVRRWKEIVSAGEPYDPAEVDPILHQFTRFRSAYYLVGRGEPVTPAPTVIYNSWVDDIMPPGEALRWAKLVEREHPEAEVGVVVGPGFAHDRGSLVEEPTLANAERDRLFARHLEGDGDAEPLDGVLATTQGCHGAPELGPFRTATWREQHPGVVALRSAGARRFGSDGGNPLTALLTDPFAGVSRPCHTVPAERDPGAATYDLPAAPAGGYTLVGSPTVTARIRVEGTFPQIAARLWDVAPDGRQTMVQHGTYRPDGDGVHTFQIHPAGWRFAEGHVARLELLGRDAPYAQPSNGRFEIVVDDLLLELPVREPPDGSAIRPYAPEELALSVGARRRQRGRTLKLAVSCPREDCTVRMRRVIRSLAAGDRATLRMRAPRNRRRVSLAVTATDDAGNEATRRVRVRVVR